MSDLVFGYLAGLLTLINPCVLPVLPIVLGSALQANRHGPLALAAGMGLTFVALGLLIATAGRSIGLTEELLSQTGAAMMILFGMVLLVPRLSHGFEMATAGMAARADTRLDTVIPPFLAGCVRRTHAAIFSFIAGVMPPMPMLGRSLL